MRNKYEEVGEKEQERRDALSEAEKKRAKGDTALTQILCFNGVTAYRRGKWEVGSSTLSDPVYERREWEEKGVRVRVLTQGLVYCRWGRALSSQKTAEMENETGNKIHGDARRGSGFMQFTDVEGVFDWLGAERRGRRRRKRGWLFWRGWLGGRTLVLLRRRWCRLKGPRRKGRGRGGRVRRLGMLIHIVELRLRSVWKS